MKPINDISQLDLSKKYSYADYILWQFNERVELIKGFIHKMAPAPKRIHQEIEGNLYFEMRLKFKGKKCSIYQSPFDVRLIKNIGQNNKEINTVVQPDICVVCDISKLDDLGCIGAPDLIVEVLSDSTAKKDYNEKFNLYEENKVKEYWIANPATKTIEIFSLENKTYKSIGLFNEKDGIKTIKSIFFPDLSIPVSNIFT